MYRRRRGRIRGIRTGEVRGGVAIVQERRIPDRHLVVQRVCLGGGLCLLLLLMVQLVVQLVLLMVLLLLLLLEDRVV